MSGHEVQDWVVRIIRTRGREQRRVIVNQVPVRFRESVEKMVHQQWHRRAEIRNNGR